MEKIGLQGVFETAAFASGLKTYTSGISTATGKTEEASWAMGDRLSSSLSSALNGYTMLAAGVAAAVAYIVSSTKAAAEAEANMTRLAATLKATGREAEISTEEISKSAAALMEMSAFDDDDIVAAYNGLLRFESIPTNKMESITKVAMDMSAALGGKVADNAEALGRALETGVIPRTWGFSAALKEQFKSMNDAGNSAGALTLMMDELNKRYGGQAAAQLTTYNGQMSALKISYDEMKESSGAYFLELIKNSGVIPNATQHFREQTAEIDLLSRARAAGLNVMGFSNYLQEGDLLRMVTEAEKGLTTAKTEGAAASTEVVLTTEQVIAAETNAAASAALYAAQLAANALEYQAITSYATSYDTSVNNIAAAEEKLAAVQKANPMDKTAIEEARLAVENLQAAQERMTNAWVLGILTQQLSMGGLTTSEMDFLLQYQIDTGLITAGSAARASKLYADALTMASGYNQAAIAANGVSSSVAGIPDGKTSYIDIVTRQTTIFDTQYASGYRPAVSSTTKPIAVAAGGDFYLTKPTLFLAGESGPERAVFTPLGGRGGDTSGGAGGGKVSNMTNNITVNNPTAEPASTSVNSTLTKLNYLGAI